MEVTGQMMNDRILVRVDSSAEVSPGGIVLPGNRRDKEGKGTVLAVGPGSWNHTHNARNPMTVLPGDKVVFSQFAGTEVKLGNETFLCLREEDVFIILK